MYIYIYVNIYIYIYVYIYIYMYINVYYIHICVKISALTGIAKAIHSCCNLLALVCRISQYPLHFSQIIRDKMSFSNIFFHVFPWPWDTGDTRKRAIPA